jgi:hypothetical protein
MYNMDNTDTPPSPPPSFDKPKSLYPNRRWLIIPESIVPNINFSQVLEKPNKLRYNQDHSKTYVSYDINIFDTDQETTNVDAKTLEPIVQIIPAGIYGRPDVYDVQYPEYIQSEFDEMLKSPEWGVL